VIAAADTTPAVGNARLVRVLSGLVPINLGVQACSFVSSIALARVLGASASTDAYFVGLSVPVLVYTILLAALRLGAIPALTARTVADGRASLGRASSELVSAVVVAAAGLSVAVTVVAAVALPPLLGGGAAHATRLTIVELAPLGVLGAATGAVGATLAAVGVFWPSVAVMALEPIAKAIFTFALGDRIGIQALILGNLVGSTLALAALCFAVRRRGVDLRPVRAVRSPFVRSVLVVSVPLLASQTVLQVNPLVDRLMASDLGSGSVTSLELGLRLFLVPTGLLTATLIAPITASWAARKAEGGWPALRPAVTRATVAAVQIAPPLVLLGLLLRHELIALIYEGGAYSAHALGETVDVFGLLLLSLPAQVLVVVFSTLFIVEGDAILPMKIAVANVVLNVTLNFALRPWLGVGGIALSTSLTFTILVGVYIVVAHRRWRPVAAGALRAASVRAVLATVAVAAVAGLALAALPEASTRLELLAVVATVGGAGIVVQALMLLASAPRLSWRTGA